MRSYQDEHAEIERRLRQMAGVVEHALDLSLTAVSERSEPHARQVIEIEPRVDSMEWETDDLITSVIALHQLPPPELRHLAGAIKITGELERMADHAVSIADHAFALAAAPHVPIPVDWARLGGLVKTMVHRSLDAYLRQDAGAADQVLRTEQAVNALHDEIVEELITLMHEQPAQLRPALDLILVARKLERIADHATNIAEDVHAVTRAMGAAAGS
jgi:phosphate transport system protein